MDNEEKLNVFSHNASFSWNANCKLGCRMLVLVGYGQNGGFGIREVTICIYFMKHMRLTWYFF
jgi:hypothetical protein